MWFEIQFHWLMSKTSRTEIIVWPTKTTKTLAMTKNKRKNGKNTEKFTEYSMKIMNVVISIHVTVFHCVSEMFSLLIFSFFLRVFLSLVSAKKCNQPFCLFIVTTIMSGSIYIIHPHLSAMCQILQFRINVFLSESATTKKKTFYLSVSVLNA